VLDTFRQSLASRLFWLLLGLSGLCIALCLTVRIEGATAARPPGEIELFGRDRKPFTGRNGGEGYLSVAFGAVRVAIPRDEAAAVGFLHSLIAQAPVMIGTLLLVVWTSGFLPDFLEQGSAAVILAKPVPRWALLAGKFLGVLLFVTFQVGLFVGGTWLALALGTGVWRPAPLLGVPLLVLLFAVLYSFSSLLAVCTRSTIACIFGTLLFWLVCARVNHAHYAEQSVALDAAYWVLPKPADCAALLHELLQSKQHFAVSPTLARAVEERAIVPELSVLTSILSAAGLLALAGWRLGRQDY
jgi:ABC-type transport system involved in multi-copper enzyme maturation permease subunit